MMSYSSFFNRFGFVSKKILELVQKDKQFNKNIFTSFIFGEKVSFNLSDIGEGIKEVVIKEWFVKVGDKVSQFDNICEVQSDKASVTITSRYDGIITKLHYNIDETALVGKPLVDLETEDQEASQLLNEQIPFQKTKTEEHNSNEYLNTSPKEAEHDAVNKDNLVLCIPSVRRLAKEYKVDLSKIKGTGKHGRILKEDILHYIESPSPKSNVTTIPSPPQMLNFDKDESIIEPIKGFKKAMVKTMTEALKIPHFGYSDEIKVTKLSKLRKDLQSIPDLQGNKITFMPFFIKATSNALHRYPVINSSIDENCENIIYHKSHNIGVAMDTSAGLAVPVIKNVQDLTVIEITTELNKLINSGKNGVFAPDDLIGGTFSISNIGIIGGTYTKPVILPPQVAIAAVGMSQVLPRFDELGNVIPEEIINISASADHRVIDGVTMASFIRHLKRQIENPYLLFLNL